MSINDELWFISFLLITYIKNISYWIIHIHEYKISNRTNHFIYTIHDNISIETVQSSTLIHRTQNYPVILINYSQNKYQSLHILQETTKSIQLLATGITQRHRPLYAGFEIHILPTIRKMIHTMVIDTMDLIVIIKNYWE